MSHSHSEMSDEETGLGYQNTLMYGRYTRDLSAAARSEARRLKRLDRRRRKDDKAREKELNDKPRGKFAKAVGFVWRNTFARLGEDWVFLALLGIIVALLSFIMDRGISMCNNARIWMYRDLAGGVVTKYFAWVSLPVILILFSAGFVHIVAPQAIGSGIPEMKTILRGVNLKEYLTFKTLVAKVVGLTATLGSGMPLGKEGPFVHIGSMVASLLSKLVTSFQGIYENESRTCEMLAAACAVGVGSCFAAPIGGVLFSIEVTTVYFAVRNYWRGFFAAVCGATVYRLLAVWTGGAHTVTAMFPTNFAMDFPFDPQELVAFALMGAVSGLIGAAFVWLHRQYVISMRNSKRINKFLQQNRFLYPGIVCLMIASITFPMGLGQYIAGDLTTHDQVMSLFSNFTWTSDDLPADQAEVLKHWSTPHSGVFVSLTAFTVSTFFLTIVASTIPVPAGIFIPVFKIGAGFGRIMGELVHAAFPLGLRYGGYVSPILPGGYACVGAAAVSGAVTHTVSVAVIVLEMTGQVTHVVPLVTAVLVANAVASLLQPSAYDSIILIKKLPYLPDLLTGHTGMYNMNVEDFMEQNIKYVWNGITYQRLKEILKENKGLRSLPLVDSPDSMILLGSVQRAELVRLIDKHVGRERRLQVAAQKQQEAAEKAREEQKKKTRRPSRFEPHSVMFDPSFTPSMSHWSEDVSPAPDILRLQVPQSPTLQHGCSVTSTDQSGLIPGALFRPKSILKKTNSFTLMRPAMSSSNATSPTSPVPHPSVYSTVTGAESRIRMAFEAIFKKSTTLQDVNPDPESGVAAATSRGELEDAEGDYSPPPTPLSNQRSPSINKKVQLPGERVCDMSPAEQRAWEQGEMALPADFMKMRDRDPAGVEGYCCRIDPAPFQLVEKTSLLKVHSLFSMVGVNMAYVTTIGRLVGIIGLKELRLAIEKVNGGTFVQPVAAEAPETPEKIPLDQDLTPTKEESLPLSINRHD